MTEGLELTGELCGISEVRVGGAKVRMKPDLALHARVEPVPSGLCITEWKLSKDPQTI